MRRARRYKPTLKPRSPRRHQGQVGRMKEGSAATASASAILQELLTPDNRVALNRLMKALRMSKADIAETIGVARETLQRAARADAPKTQTRLREMLEIVNRVSGWAGGQMQAMAWYRSEPIPAFGGRTAESLVKEGKAAAVRDYLDGVALGGFA